MAEGLRHFGEHRGVRASAIALTGALALSACGAGDKQAAPGSQAGRETHAATASPNPSPDTSGTFTICNNIYEGARGNDRLVVFRPTIRMVGNRAMVLDAEATPAGFLPTIVELNAKRADTTVQMTDIWLDLKGDPAKPDCAERKVSTSRIKVLPQRKETWVAGLDTLPDAPLRLDPFTIVTKNIVALNFREMSKEEASQVVAQVNGN
ncbi:MAG TPA: hypothetical protein VLF60_03860 [Candidatus Saccharimonadales bacterium]|nr:hypothetical protein [Candidatus Saccharimonadales bacterium]